MEDLWIAAQARNDQVLRNSKLTAPRTPVHQCQSVRTGLEDLRQFLRPKCIQTLSSRNEFWSRDFHF